MTDISLGMIASRGRDIVALGRSSVNPFCMSLGDKSDVEFEDLQCKNTAVTHQLVSGEVHLQKLTVDVCWAFQH